MTFSQRLTNYADGIGNYLRTMPHVFLLSDMPGNIGDHLIWTGTERLLAQQGIHFERISRTSVEEVSKEFRDSTLVVPGSGALSHDWHEWLPKTVITAASQFKTVIILPSEYEPTVEIVHSALELRNVWAFARDAWSFVKIKRYGRAAIAPDLALFTDKFKALDNSFRSDGNLGTVLIALRTDKSSMLSRSNFRPVQSNNDVSLTFQSLDKFMDYIQQHDSVITDRLHVAVGSLMLGKTVRFVDPSNQKISRYAKFNFGDDFAGHFQQRNESWLLDNGFIERIIS